MKVAPFDEGEPESLENYRYILGRQEGDFHLPRHRYNKFPRPRYESVVNPAHFNWLPMQDEVGVERKHLGSFTERGCWIELIKTDAGVEWLSPARVALRVRGTRMATRPSSPHWPPSPRGVSRLLVEAY